MKALAGLVLVLFWVIIYLSILFLGMTLSASMSCTDNTGKMCLRVGSNHRPQRLEPVSNFLFVSHTMLQKKEQTDAELRTTAWAYDNAGRVTSRTLPEGQQETFSYDNASNRTGHIDFNGASHTFGFDNLNRETTAIYADGIVVATTYTDTGHAKPHGRRRHDDLRLRQP